MKLFVAPLILTLCLAACTEKKFESPQAPAKRVTYYKKVSDKQMTEDLNDCAYQMVKSSIRADSPGHSKDVPLTKKECMEGKGYKAVPRPGE